MLYHGKRYKTIKDFCTAYNLNYRTTIIRLSRGYTLDEVLIPAHPGRSVKKSDHGQTAKAIDYCVKIGPYVFTSYRKAAEHFSIHHRTVAKICESTEDLVERYEKCKDHMCFALRTNRCINPFTEL